MVRVVAKSEWHRRRIEAAHPALAGRVVTIPSGLRQDQIVPPTRVPRDPNCFLYTGGYDRGATRGKLRFQPSERFELVLSGDWARSDRSRHS